jgi:alpha-beta hydrolase superfamily lysophospholipase/thioredoxin-like negative regulator of GroEL
MSHRGIAVYAIDVRGFGSWWKAGGHSEVDFNGCLEDVRQALVSIRKANPGLPVFLLGESMGGAIALRAATMYPDLIDGLVSSVPAGDRFHQKRTDLKVAFELFKGPNRSFDIGSQVDKQLATKKVVDDDKKTKTEVDEKLLADVEKDPLDRMDLSPKELMQFQKFMNENHDSVKNMPPIPVLIVQGADDRLVKPAATWELVQEMATPHRWMIVAPCRHLIFEDSQDQARETTMEVNNLLFAWLLTHLPESAIQQESQQQASAKEKEELKQAIDDVVAARYDHAQQLLQAIIKSDPQDSQAHYWLGVLSLKTQDNFTARREFKTALALEKGGPVGNRANKQLLAIAGTPVTPNDPAFRSAAARLTHGRPAVVIFYAKWCEEREKLDATINRVKANFGNRAAITVVDVTDSDNDGLVKAFDVGPIPTMVFLKANGNIYSTAIGQTDYASVSQSIAGLLQ